MFCMDTCPRTDLSGCLGRPVAEGLCLPCFREGAVALEAEETEEVVEELEDEYYYEEE